jgi:hypothetical protein
LRDRTSPLAGRVSLAGLGARVSATARSEA